MYPMTLFDLFCVTLLGQIDENCYLFFLQDHEFISHKLKKTWTWVNNGLQPQVRGCSRELLLFICQCLIQFCLEARQIFECEVPQSLKSKQLVWVFGEHEGVDVHAINLHPLKTNMKPQKCRFGRWFSFLKGVMFIHVSFRGEYWLLLQLNQPPTTDTLPTSVSPFCFLHIFNQGFTRFGQTRMDLWRDSWLLFFCFVVGPWVLEIGWSLRVPYLKLTVRSP